MKTSKKKNIFFIEHLRVAASGKRQTLYKTIDVHAVKKAVGEGISSKNKWDIVNQFSTWKIISPI